MPRSPKPSDVIEAVYDAGLEPARWGDVIVALNAFLGSQACGLISKDPVSQSGATHHYCGVDPHFIQLYAETYSRYDPLARLPRYGEVRNIPDLVNFETYRRGRFYQEWLRPQGCADVANVVLDRSNTPCPMLMTVIPGRDMLDEAMRKRMHFLVPHVSRALMINRAVGHRPQLANVLSDVVDSLSTGVFLLDGSCRIVHSNPAAASILATTDVLRSISGRLVARAPEVNLVLREIFTDAKTVAAASACGRSIALTAHDGLHYVAHVIALPSLMRDPAAIQDSAVGALMIWKAEFDTRSYAPLIDRAFELTRAELRVLQAIVEVGGVPETALALGIAETTVKTHLHRVFAKTGVSRQADLVRLAAGFSNPLVH